jgi:ribonuclease R
MAKKKKKKTKKGEFSQKNIITHIRAIFDQNPKQTLNYKQVSAILMIKDNSTKRLINSCLVKMAQSDELEEVSRGKFRMKPRDAYITGRVDLTAKGSAYIISDDIDKDVFIAAKNLNKALHDDIVKVYVYAQRRRNHVEGEVVEVLERKRDYFVGKLEITKNYAFLVPERRQLPVDIFIPLERLNKGKHGQKAIAKIVDWPDTHKSPIGEIVEVLGQPGENDVEMHAILAEFGLPYSFPEKVLQAANRVPVDITQEEIAKRRDFRDITTFTIDPFDAKDFDDALSYRELENGNIEVGIHIADVTHYVRPNTVLEKEAFARATSVYLVDRVVPMLPEKLSNLVCSLRPNEEKLVFSAVFELDAEANIKNEWFGKSIINSNRRFTY